MKAHITANNGPKENDPSSKDPFAQFLIYKNSNFFCDSTLTKEQISIGSSRFADVILENSAVADFHALVHFHDGQAFLTNNYPNDGLRLNGSMVKNAELRSRDIIQIGPFALHFKMAIDDPDTSKSEKQSASFSDQNMSQLTDHYDSKYNSEDQQGYVLILINQYINDESRNNAALRLAKLFKLDPRKTKSILAKKKFVLKTNLSQQEADKWHSVLKNAGVLCIIQKIQKENQKQSAKKNLKAKDCHELSAVKKEVGFASSNISEWPQPSYEEEEEQEEDIWEAPFTLSEIINSDNEETAASHRDLLHLQIIKQIDNSISGVNFLGKKKKYTDLTNIGLFQLAEHVSEGKAYAYFTKEFYGHVNNPGEGSTDLDSFKSDSYLSSRRKQIYRIPIAKNGSLSLSIGNIKYLISLKHENASPKIDIIPEKNTFSWRHWATSVGTHAAVLLCIMLYGYIQVTAPKPISPQFVKIDTALMEQLQNKKTIKEEPKKQPQPPESEAVKVEPAKSEQPKTKPPQTMANTPKKSGKRTDVAQVSKHPKAGGGFGEGNITNRNINQTGLLGVLGSGNANGPSDVIATVTNLDAVEVPGASEKNFTVGGLKGSLGTGKISLASGAVVQTKGSSQVLRSAGARGEGEVAALERGDTGMKQVKSLVTAPMSRTVKIEGGMSREMVKRVIDQHLDEITYCYESALIGNPSIMGRIVFEWKILMSGGVGEIRIMASSVNSNEIHECIKSAIKSWQFPKPVGSEVVVSYPFIFDLVAF